MSDKPIMDNWTPRELTQEELHETLTKACEFGGVVERPLIFSRDKFKIASLELNEKEIVILLEEEMAVDEETRHLCIDLNYRKLSFILKKNEYQVEGCIIRAPIPTQAKAIIKRPYPRYKLDFNSFPTAVTRSERRGGEFELEGFVEDISMNGLSVLIKCKNGEELKSNDHIWIKTLAGKDLTTHIFGKVVYAKTVTIDDVQYLKAGVRLEREFEEQFFNSLIENHLEILAA